MDFIAFPIYIGLHRAEMIDQITAIAGLDAKVQADLIVSVMKPYAPKTLQGAGMFHLAFGALLTGATIKDKLGRG